MSIQIDQTLHGYAQGHSLLRSSVRLPSDAERLMLGLSDLSGQGMRAEFDAYLTGYPVIKHEIYALSRTWYATEMRRPGCVWTHSLLVRYDDLARINDIRPLRRYFRRPAQLQPDESYSRRLTLNVEEPDLSGTPEFVPPDLTRSVVWYLYGLAAKPVYILAQAADQYESLVLDLWSQQWPGLRQEFSFCTGALANRLLRGRPLDLQVMPRESVSELRRVLSLGSMIDPVAQLSSASNDPPWLEVAIDDITSGPQSNVRRIAWEIAGQDVNDRASFPAVFYFASILERYQTLDTSADSYVRAITDAASILNVPPPLLKALFDPRHSSAIPEFSERSLLTALASEDAANLNTVDIDVIGRAERLLEHNRTEALQLFSDLISLNRTTGTGNQILVGICRNLQADDIDSLAETKPGILSMVVTQEPELATTPAIWKLSANLQAEIFHTIMTKNIPTETFERIVGSILRSQTNVVPEQAFQYGDRLVEPVLEWLNADGSSLPSLSRTWNHYLRSNVDVVLAWLSHNGRGPMVLLTVAKSIPADTVDALGLHAWRPLLELLPSLSDQDTVPVAAFLLALGLRHCDDDAKDFVKRSFEYVHAAAANSLLEYDYWRPISEIAPPIAYWRQWDKCERLRAVLIDRFIECNWPRDDLLKVSGVLQNLELVFALARTGKRRRKFLRRVAAAAAGDTSLPNHYRNLLKEYDEHEVSE